MADAVSVLARLRVPLGFLSAAAVLWLASPVAGSLAAGSLIAVAGEALRFWAAGHLNKSREVTSSGPYRWMAHPLYVGSSIMGAGLAVACNRPIVAAIIASYLAATIGAAIRKEEAFLRQRFGDGYQRYKAGERALSSGAGRMRRFSMSQAIANREYRAVIGLVIAMLLLLFKATYNGTF